MNINVSGLGKQSTLKRKRLTAPLPLTSQWWEEGVNWMLVLNVYYTMKLSPSLPRWYKVTIFLVLCSFLHSTASWFTTPTMSVSLKPRLIFVSNNGAYY